MKLILWILLILVVLHLLRKKKAERAASMRASASAGPEHREDNLNGEVMLPCAHCGVYIPQSESIPAPRGLAFCSDAHRRLHSTS